MSFLLFCLDFSRANSKTKREIFEVAIAGLLLR